MKTLHAKQNSIRTMMTAAFAFVMLAVMSVSQEAAVMATGSTGWGRFKEQMTNFFYTGLGGDGMQGVGIVIAVVGVAMAVISFVVHKMNPQSRLPGWVTCLVIAVLGSMLFTGIKPALDIIKWIRNTVMGWFGIGMNGTDII